MLRLNVGFSRKKGESHFGSRGASVQLEVELASDFIGQPARLKRRVRQLFSLAKSAVDEELAQVARYPDAAGGVPTTRTATLRQTRALMAIAQKQEIDLQALLGDRFGIAEPKELSIVQASHLIHELRQVPMNSSPAS